MCYHSLTGELISERLLWEVISVYFVSIHSYYWPFGKIVYNPHLSFLFKILNASLKQPCRRLLSNLVNFSFFNPIFWMIAILNQRILSWCHVGRNMPPGSWITGLCYFTFFCVQFWKPRNCLTTPSTRWDLIARSTAVFLTYSSTDRVVICKHSDAAHNPV